MDETVNPAIPCTRFLDPDGRVAAPLPPFAQEADAMIQLYRDMVLTRAFDAKAVALQRTHRISLVLAL